MPKPKQKKRVPQLSLLKEVDFLADLAYDMCGAYHPDDIARMHEEVREVQKRIKRALREYAKIKRFAAKNPGVPL